MSKVKAPAEKKALSYARERRNDYGENNKSSRKNIRKGKQRSHMLARRAVRIVLSAIQSEPDIDAADEVQHQAKNSEKSTKVRAFKKYPDEPLRVVLAARIKRRMR